MVKKVVTPAIASVRRSIRRIVATKSHKKIQKDNEPEVWATSGPLLEPAGVPQLLRADSCQLLLGDDGEDGILQRSDCSFLRSFIAGLECGQRRRIAGQLRVRKEILISVAAKRELRFLGCFCIHTDRQNHRSRASVSAA